MEGYDWLGLWAGSEDLEGGDLARFVRVVGCDWLGLWAGSEDVDRVDLLGLSTGTGELGGGGERLGLWAEP